MKWLFPRAIWIILIAFLIGLWFWAIAVSNSSQPRSAAARAGGDLASVNPASEVAVRHPLKDQGRVPQ